MPPTSATLPLNMRRNWGSQDQHARENSKFSFSIVGLEGGPPCVCHKLAELLLPPDAKPLENISILEQRRRRSTHSRRCSDMLEPAHFGCRHGLAWRAGQRMDGYAMCCQSDVPLKTPFVEHLEKEHLTKFPTLHNQWMLPQSCKSLNSTF